MHYFGLHFSETNAIFVVENDSKYREVVFYKDYFNMFFVKQPKDIQKRIIRIFDLIEYLKIIPEKMLKHIRGSKGLYEIRIITGRKSIRVFCFFDKGKLIILANAFVKKSKKTPYREIEKAMRIKKEYENGIR